MNMQRSKKSVRSARRTKTYTQRHAENRSSFLQLAVCLLLFLAVYVGKGLVPEHMVQIGDRLLAVMATEVDFRSALIRLGGSIAGEGELAAGLENFCIEVFGGGTEDDETGSEANSVTYDPKLLESELKFLGASPNDHQLTDHYLYYQRGTQLLALGSTQKAQNSLPQDPALPEEEEESVPAVGTVLLYADYDGKPLPDNCTLDQISLGGMETVVPVLGVLTSSYGYRDHPISGDYLFHTGVDIDGKTGDPILAFSAGTVEYVGKDDSYGLYFQLDHGNGIKSFYAHCSSVCVTKGQSVAVGETVAKIGTSGNVTGPHLHFELKFHKLRLDPTYYLEFL